MSSRPPELREEENRHGLKDWTGSLRSAGQLCRQRLLCKEVSGMLWSRAHSWPCTETHHGGIKVLRYTKGRREAPSPSWGHAGCRLDTDWSLPLYYSPGSPWPDSAAQLPGGG